MDARAREPAQRSGERTAGRRDAGSRLRALPRIGSEDALQLIGRRDFQLIVAALRRRLVGTPAHELRGVPETRALHVVVRHFAHALRTQRLPAQILPAVPSTGRAGHPLARFACLLLRLRPIAPRMVFERVLAQRRQLLDELFADGVGERGGPSSARLKRQLKLRGREVLFSVTPSEGRRFRRSKKC